jgi:Fanconi anemia group M protein
MKELKVIIDSRERNIDLIGALETSGLEIDVRTLPVGDYIVSDRLCIERKTISDFESSIMNGRLFEQLERLKKAYSSPIMVLEGSTEDFRLKRNVINGTIVSIYVDYGIPIILSTGPIHTAEIIAGITKREQIDKERLPSLKGASRAHTDNQFREFVIGNLPGVGPKTAKALLNHFGSIKRITNASPKALAKVNKIGEKKAERIYEMLNQRYEAEAALAES